MIEQKKCEWCENGLCVYFRSEEQQYDDEQEGLPTDWCDGSEEYMRECGMLDED